MGTQWFVAPEYWLAREVLQRGVATIYLVAFVAAARQFRPLIGERGMLPVPAYVARVPFRAAPSLFHLRYSDRLFAAVSWFGAARNGTRATYAGTGSMPRSPISGRN